MTKSMKSLHNSARVLLIENQWRAEQSCLALTPRGGGRPSVSLALSPTPIMILVISEVSK